MNYTPIQLIITHTHTYNIKNTYTPLQQLVINYTKST